MSESTEFPRHDPPTVPVDSVHGRTGAVVSAASDYAASQVANDSGVAGAFVDDALDQLDGDVSTNATAIAALTPVTYAKTQADSPYTCPGDAHSFVQVDATGGTTLIYSPASPVAGQMVSIVKTDASANQARMMGTSGAKVSGAAGVIHGTRWVGATYITDGTDWFAI